MVYMDSGRGHVLRHASSPCRPDCSIRQPTLHATCLPFLQLCDFQHLLLYRDHKTIRHIRPVKVTRTGGPGRPAKVIHAAWLREGVSARRRLRITTLASIINVSRPTLRKYLKANRLKRAFSTLADEELDALVRYYKLRHPVGGLRYVTGFLQKLGVRVQRWRVADSMHRVDGIGRTLRRHTKIRRRQYKVKRPHALWHVDGHHKLIRWGIVVHAFIDGYTRVVCCPS